jgi:hypothetical protein
MPYLRLLLFALLAAASLAFHGNTADAYVCGGINKFGQWVCTATCNTGFRSAGQVFPDRASCLKRSLTPAQTVKKEAAPPKRKVAQVSEPKKPAVKPPKKTVAAKPPLKKQEVKKQEVASAEQEPVPSKVVAATPQAQQPVVEANRNVDPSAKSPQPVASANLTVANPEPQGSSGLSALPRQQVLGRSIALVIGNSHYASVPALTNPAGDASAIAKTLQAAGFEKVTLKLDLDRQSLWTALGEFARESSRADWAVIYFAGHGIELDGQNYVIPTDARLETDSHVLFETVPLDHVVEATAGARKFRLVILDACRNNPFLATMSRVASTRSIGRGLSQVEPHGGVLVAYAAKAGEVALDGDAGNSPFVVALIEQLNRPGVEVGFLFRKVRDSVIKQTNGAQEPYTYGSLPGDEELYFRPPVN